MPEGRILFLDAYDSFSNNIVTLLKDHLPVTVESIKINDARFVFNDDDAFRDFLNKFDAVVAGPGPGHPANVDDVGLIDKLWSLSDDHVLPILGICLGFQSLTLAFGADIERLQEPRHGLVRRLTHCGQDIFTGIGEIEATQYHSLHVSLSHKAHHDNVGNLWTPSRAPKQIVPLAWDLSDERKGPILMGARHCHLPFWGVQYHPESICSTGGAELIRSWWAEACRWNAAHLRGCTVTPVFKEIDRKHGDANVDYRNREPCTVQWQSVPCSSFLDAADIANLMRTQDAGRERILLESGIRDGKPINPKTGRFSIIGLPSNVSLQLRWSVTDQLLTVEAGSKVFYSKQASIKEVFAAVDSIIDEYKASDGPTGVPFWGGLVGYISYEAGLETINVPSAEARKARPDVWFMLVERSLVVDHVAHMAFVQSIKDDDRAWLSQTVKLLLDARSRPLADRAVLVAKTDNYIVAGPAQDEYCAKVSACQEQLRAGESYELCLTDQTLIRNLTDSWALYQNLRQVNPAPFGAYLRFSDAHASTGVDVIGSSPERFLSWSRNGRCQFRPIKGTVKKTPDMTRADAEAILSSEKERAENLMIVDLIRHDLSGVEGVRKVHVPKLMCVEEYETVYQLVSIIEGDLDSTTPHTAALAPSLPPGSMTGAPKKRSCELLTSVEGVDKPRGLYSGVLGYLDVGGGGDFSVVIRTAFKWADEDVWRVGAGGAVTALSEPVAEWEEMLAKRESVLDVLSASL